VLVLEAENTCGGTWGADRLYPGLKSNNLLDTYEYPDFPMLPEIYGVQPGEHIPGPVLHRYLTDFAKKFGVFARTRFSTKVESLQPTEKDQWTLNASSKGLNETLRTKKIIIATGLTSQANFPIYPGAETFEKPYFHGKDFCRNGDTVKTASNAVIVGAGKSAMDTAYAYAEAGAHVDMVIRKNGNGPCWISYPWVLGGKKRLEKLLSVRFLTWFSPCPFGGVDGWQWVRNFLHGTAVGRFLVDKFWASLGGEVIDVNGYRTDPELGKLQPWNSAFWIGSGLSIHNYDQDLFDMVKKRKINVHLADVEHLTNGTVHLTDGTELKTDVLVCATGWLKDPSIRFSNFGSAGIGLTQPPTEQARLAADADEEILRSFPRLRDQPHLNFTPKPKPFRLYRFIVPPAYIDKRNIAFAGMVSSVSTAMAANAQALVSKLMGKTMPMSKTFADPFAHHF
jgi:cation diffusion facilitator CzcD-associated flavoprotein CzcO